MLRYVDVDMCDDLILKWLIQLLQSRHTYEKSTRSIDRLKKERARAREGERFLYECTQKQSRSGSRYLSCICNFLSNVHFLLFINRAWTLAAMGWCFCRSIWDLMKLFCFLSYVREIESERTNDRTSEQPHNAVLITYTQMQQHTFENATIR